MKRTTETRVGFKHLSVPEGETFLSWSLLPTSTLDVLEAAQGGGASPTELGEGRSLE